MKRWFTFEEIAAELDIPLQSLYFYRRRGDGPKVLEQENPMDLPDGRLKSDHREPVLNAR